MLEKLARGMLAKDPSLEAEFRNKLHDDPAFAADPRARLQFFYRHSPWYAAQRIGEYPVLRLDSAALQRLESQAAPPAPARGATPPPSGPAVE